MNCRPEEEKKPSTSLCDTVSSLQGVNNPLVDNGEAIYKKVKDLFKAGEYGEAARIGITDYLIKPSDLERPHYKAIDRLAHLAFFLSGEGSYVSSSTWPSRDRSYNNIPPRAMDLLRENVRDFYTTVEREERNGTMCFDMKGAEELIRASKWFKEL